MTDQIENAPSSSVDVERGMAHRGLPGPSLIAGLHPIVVKLALSAVAWFLAVAWLDFAGDHELSLALTLVNGAFVVLFTLLLVAVSMVVGDPRWNRPRGRFAGFLKDGKSANDATAPEHDILTIAR